MQPTALGLPFHTGPFSLEDYDLQAMAGTPMNWEDVLMQDISSPQQVVQPSTTDNFILGLTDMGLTSAPSLSLGSFTQGFANPVTDNILATPFLATAAMGLDIDHRDMNFLATFPAQPIQTTPTVFGCTIIKVLADPSGIVTLQSTTKHEIQLMPHHSGFHPTLQGNRWSILARDLIQTLQGDTSGFFSYATYLLHLPSMSLSTSGVIDESPATYQARNQGYSYLGSISHLLQPHSVETILSLGLEDPRNRTYLQAHAPACPHFLLYASSTLPHMLLPPPWSPASVDGDLHSANPSPVPSTSSLSPSPYSAVAPLPEPSLVGPEEVRRVMDWIRAVLMDQAPEECSLIGHAKRDPSQSTALKALQNTAALCRLFQLLGFPLPANNSHFTSSYVEVLGQLPVTSTQVLEVMQWPPNTLYSRLTLLHQLKAQFEGKNQPDSAMLAGISDIQKRKKTLTSWKAAQWIFNHLSSSQVQPPMQGEDRVTYKEACNLSQRGLQRDLKDFKELRL